MMSTPFLDNIYTEIDFDRDLVFKFFTIFCMFEYALKQGKYKNKSGDAKADWNKFARDVHKKFDPNSDPDLIKAVKYFLSTPPKKQVIEDGQVVFQDCPAAKNTNTEDLSVYIRRVRNNLFHGGKFRYDRPRDTNLIQYALTILEAWAHLDQDVYRELENALW